MGIDNKQAAQSDDLVAQGGEFRIMLERMVAGSSGQIALVDSNGIIELVTLSGDATIAAGGAITIAALAVETSMIAALAVSTAKIAAGAVIPSKVGTVADVATGGGVPVLYRIDTAGGATADTNVTVDSKIRVIDAWVVNNAAGTASDTITVKNGSSAITDAMDISGGDKTIKRAATIDNANHEIAASGTLKITETDGGSNDSPATTVYVLAVKVA